MTNELDIILDKINTRLNTYYGLDDGPWRKDYRDGAATELIIIKDFVVDLIKKSKNHPDKND